MTAKSKDWQAIVKGLLKAELKRRDLSYADLASKLAAIGIKGPIATFLTKFRVATLRQYSSCSAWKLSAAEHFIFVMTCNEN